MYRDLDVWKKSMELVKEIYVVTKNFPDDEKFGIISQMRRAAVSIPSNIAEGSARFSDKEKSRFLDITIGSIAELETQLIISKDLGYIDNIEQILEKLKLINSMSIKLKKYYKTL